MPADAPAGRRRHDLYRVWPVELCRWQEIHAQASLYARAVDSDRRCAPKIRQDGDGMSDYMDRVLTNALIELERIVEKFHAKPKRGPTPCATCRWHLVDESKGWHDCTAKGQAGGCVTLCVDVLPIGCPQHEEAS